MERRITDLGPDTQLELAALRARVSELERETVERRRTIQALRETEQRFRKIFDHSNDAVLIIDPARDEILEVNPKACAMLDYSREELLATPISAIHPKEMPDLLASSRAIFERGDGWTLEVTCRTKQGETLPAEMSASPIEVGGRTCVIAMVRDITQRKRAERILRESEERLSCILESAMDAIITVDEEGHVVLFNNAAEKVFRCQASQAIAQPFSKFLTQLRYLLQESVQSFGLNSGTKQNLWAPDGLTARRFDGEEFPVEATISRVEVSGRRFLTVILRDINERKRAELELQKLQLKTGYLEEVIRSDFGEIIGISPAMKKVFQNVERVANTDSTVLLTGETGTGKELIASALHNRSKRKNNLLVKVNCAALPPGLVESELFGHERGAFTGALSRKIGRFELAHQGTIFLDEIGDLSLELQSKLLRVLQEGEFERVGGSHSVRVDVRVIAATNRNLERAIQEEEFRLDLYYRLNVFPIALPPLRERAQDIELLVRHFISKYSKKLGKKFQAISKKALDALLAYSWPGNVRELENIIERTCIISQEGQLELGEWIPKSIAPPGGSSFASLEEHQREHILEALEFTGGQVSGKNGAAVLLGIKPTTLEARMKKLGIRRKVAQAGGSQNWDSGT